MVVSLASSLTVCDRKEFPPWANAASETTKAQAPWCLGLRIGTEGERVTRIELAFSAWEADVLPLNYTREERRDATNRPLASGGRRIGGCRVVEDL